ncbi:relaxin receptor 2 [Folsomia candida]|nr:relaxin receptor 2 [Folsomia candida]
MRCAVSFLCVVCLTFGVGVAALFIIKWSSQSLQNGGGSANFSCPSKKWKCDEADICIPAEARCNIVKDCPLGSDEDMMNCNYMEQTIKLLMRNWKCGQEKNNNGFASNTTKTPEGCNMNEAAIFCSSLDKIPWEGFNLHAKVLTLADSLNVTELTNELIPPKKTTINKLFVENSTILTLGQASICHWDHACWMSFVNNSIQNLAMGAFCVLPELQWLTLSNNRITLDKFRFPDMPKLQDLMLDNNKIEVITDGVFRRLRKLVSLNLMGNKIRTIESRAFRFNVNLQDLDLSNNLLKELPPLVFEGQTNLQKLYLADNPFINIPDQVFSQLRSLVSLNLNDVEFSALQFDVLDSLPKLDYVQFKKFGYCRYVPKVTRCYPFSDGMSSTMNLLAGTSIRVIVWIVALFTIVGNSVVLITRCLSAGRGRILDVFINNLAGADLLMGIYLVILAVKDIQYRNSYNDHAYEWSTSFVCTGMGIIAMISCEVSLLILTFMSVERYLVISDPFSYHKKLSLNLSRISMIIIWFFVALLAIAPAIQWRGRVTFYGSSGLCFPVHLDEPFAIGWEYTAFVIIGLNSACLIVVAISYSKLFCVIQTTRLSTPRDTKDIEMAVRFFLMVFTDCMCWLPIILLKIYALGGHQIPKEFITWVVIFVLPINSTINPYLYGLYGTLPENRMKFFRRIIPSLTNPAFSQAINRISFPLRRHGATVTVTEESRGTPWDNATTNTSASDKMIKKKIGGRLSHQESIASSKMEDTL